jgi:two-component system, cell cycle sensor histidine kinase and response regulator CckA
VNNTQCRSLETGTGASSIADAREAGREAARQALGGIQKHPLSGVLVFASVRYDLPQLLEGVRDVSGGAPLFGATTAGEIHEGIRKKSVVVAALASPWLRFHAAVGKAVSSDWKKAVQETVEDPDLAPWFDAENPEFRAALTRRGVSVFGLLFSPGNTRHADSRSLAILEELNRRSSRRFVIAGGSAADDWRMESNAVFFNGGVHHDSMLLVIAESRLRFGCGLAHNFQPGPQRATVTRAADNEVIELDGRPAAEVYAAMLGTTREALENRHITLTTGKPAGIPDPYGQHRVNVASFFTERGGVRFAQPVPEGSQIMILDTDAEDLLAAGNGALRRALTRGGIVEPALALVFYCAQREKILGARADEELQLMRRMAPDTRFAGFCSFGEQGMEDDGVNRHNNVVVSVLVLDNALSPAAEAALENERLIAEQDEQITRLRQIQEALRSSEEKHRLLLESATDAIFSIDLETGGIIDANGGAEKLTGRGRDELIGMHYRGLHPPEEAEAIREQFEKTAQRNVPDLIRLEVQHKDGRRIPVEVSAGGMVDIGGRKVHSGIFRDIRQIRETERKLHFQADLLDQIGDAVTATDLEGNITWVNEAESRMFGLAREDMIGRNVRSFGEDPERGATQNAILETTLRDGGWQGEVVNRTPDGREVILLCRTWLMHDPEGRPAGMCGVSTDITRLREIETEQKKLERQVQHAQKLESLGVLAGGIAHDFNNLLMAILGHAEMALEDLSPHAPARGSIHEIDRAARHAADLARQMLAYSGKGRFVIEPIQINEFVNEMGHLLEVSVSKKVILKYNYADNLPVFKGDASQIRQILLNLITNASEAIGDKSGVIAISTGAMHCEREYLNACNPVLQAGLDNALPEGVYVYFEVADTGCGMDCDTLEKIFDPFFTTKFTGRGLGLAAALGILRSHHGALKIYSETGRGTTFKVLFRAEEGNAEEAAGMTRYTDSASADKLPLKGKVLLVDDEESVLAVSGKLLQRMGLEVLTAPDGRQALEIFREQAGEFDCVLLDMTMPHMDGEQTFRAMRQIREDIQVILCSGYNEQDATERFIGKGLAGFLQKPYRALELRRKLREVLPPT